MVRKYVNMPLPTMYVCEICSNGYVCVYIHTYVCTYSTSINFVLIMYVESVIFLNVTTVEHWYDRVKIPTQMF